MKLLEPDPLPPLPPGLLESVHTAAHLEALRAASVAAAAGGGAPISIRDADDPDGLTYATPSSYDNAVEAVRAAVALVDAVVASGGGGGGSMPAASGFCVCRPPGHHATPGDPMGFCLLNSAMLAARHAQRAHGLPRVLLLDIDVHHGNGSQACAYEDSSILFVDLHQAGVWPGGGALEETGKGAAAAAVS